MSASLSALGAESLLRSVLALLFAWPLVLRLPWPLPSTLAGSLARPLQSLWVLPWPWGPDLALG